MRVASFIICLLIFAVVGAAAENNPATVSPQKKRVVLAAKIVFDGRGKVLPDTHIVVEGPKIVALDPEATPVDYDLREFTVMPGWIDSHVHITWSFGADGKNAGADPIKIFASASIRQGGGMTLSQDQLNAACDEANKQGIRTLVHAYKDAVRAATLAGCTQIEHGTLADDDALKLMAEHGTYFDPQAGLVIENYLVNKQRFLGTSGYTEEGFAAMERALSLDHDIVRRAVKTPGLKVVFGTDAVAGTQGRNAEEFNDRVREAGVEPMSAMISAHSLAAEAIRLGYR